MNSKRSYLDAINEGRKRRSYTSLEQLNRSLETLEQRIDRNREEVAGYSRGTMRSGPSAPYAGPRTAPTPRTSEYRSALEQPYRSIARDIERVRNQEDGVAAFGKISEELKALREDLRSQITSGVRREFETLRQDIEARGLDRSNRGWPELGAGCRAPLGHRAVACRTGRRPQRQHAAARDRTDEGRARQPGARGNGAVGRPALG